MAKKSDYNPRIQKKINHLSRAINKIDPELANRTMAVEKRITDIKPGINDITYQVDGSMRKVRYDGIANLPITEQASLLNKLNADRYELRQERALQQLKEKGKISWQFKRSLTEQNVKLFENIQELEDKLEGNIVQAIQNEFKDLDIQVGEQWFDEADSYFQSGKGTPDLFDFYRPGEAGGFSELNAFTWNSFKVLKGLM
jgi:phage-related minor tail protein